MRLFDSHCHLDDRAFNKDRAHVVQRAASAGVGKIMTVGTDLKSSQKAIQIADTHPNIYASVGIHPHDAKTCGGKPLDALKSLAKNENVLAWGEMGLDFNRMYSPRPDQERCFIQQLEIAGDLKLPHIFHERDSKGRFFQLLKRHGRPGATGVVHCFSGSRQELEQYLAHGLFIGITGILTIQTRGADLRRLVMRIPDNRLLIETDAPYLTPAPQKNKTRRNEPAFVKSVLIKLAEIKEVKPDALADTIWENTCRLFHITPDE